MSSSGSGDVGKALVDFSIHGVFPEEDVSTRRIDASNLGPALEALGAAKSKLEAEIHTINVETAPTVQTWVENAQSLEDDIVRSRSLANEIVRRSEAPDVSGQTIREAEERVTFLQREASYNQQVVGALRSIKRVSGLLDEVEQARDERRILDSLRLLEKSWTALDDIPVSKNVRVMRLLDMRAFELKSAVHDVFDRVWNSLARVDAEGGKIAIYESREDEPMGLSDAVIGLKAYKEVDQRMALLWHGIDEAVIGPRTSIGNKKLPGIETDDSTLKLAGSSDQTINSLFSDLEQIMGFLSRRLPEELLQSLSTVMMPDLIPRIIGVWLDSAVPSSLKEMDDFQNVIGAVRIFCNSLTTMKYTGFDELQEWVDGVPKVWLSKCRETALDSVRSKLAGGLGEAKQVERIEKQTVSQAESKEIAANGTATSGADNDGWDVSWSDGEEEDKPAGNTDAATHEIGKTEDDGTDAWGWGDDDTAGASEESTGALEAAQKDPAHSAEEPAEEDDSADAWGWGDDEAAPSSPVKSAHISPTSPRKVQKQTREMVLKETYNISAMPEPVLALISAILEDGASLVATENSPVSVASPGLFSLPTLILAMFRAISPYYYALDLRGGGNMYLYNDSTYLSEQLTALSSAFKSRQDLAPRAKTMLRLENDIKTLQSFAARAYASEMTTQRTILRDLLGGAQNILQQEGLDSSDLESQIDSATARVRAMAATWNDILARSAWYQAVGSLADTLATKIITDVMDLNGIGQDDAYNIANLISRVTELDDLFLPPGTAKGEDAVPDTAKYAGSWLRLKFLSEVLQSNLNEVRYLWFESDLSLYFTPDEVVDLIGLSFVDNQKTRELVREIQTKPPHGNM